MNSGTENLLNVNERLERNEWVAAEAGGYLDVEEKWIVCGNLHG